MSDQPIDKVLRVVKPFVPIKQGIRPYPNQKVPDYMLKLVKDDSAYQAFIANPAESLKREGIQPETLDVDMFFDLAKVLRDRSKGIDSIIDKIAESVSKKETSEGRQYNFDHSRSWAYRYESAIFHERGTSEEKSKSEMVGTTNKFEQSGISIRPEEILRHEINLLFFPAQPLVTPSLVNKIKENLSTDISNELVP
jgi:hypothetical protein